MADDHKGIDLLSNPVLQEAKRLTDLGLSVHWLRPRDKIPIDSGWSVARTKSWGQLLHQYKPGYNVGWRPGAPSKIGDLYVHAIDVDVKSEAPKHVEEAFKIFEKKFPTLNGITPKVATGRGGASCHYLVGMRKPMRSFSVARSREKVAVKLGNALKPTDSDRRELTEEKLAEGWRLRPAWEIDFMGTGKQAAAPTSIHPDTGKAYLWAVPLDPKNIPEVSLPPRDPEAEEVHKVEDLPAPIEVDLENFALPEKVLTKIMTGELGDDRSRGLWGVIKMLLRCGMSRREVASVLSDPKYPVSRVAYDHAQSEDRRRAMRWIYRQNVIKAENEIKTEINADLDLLAASAQDVVLSTEDAEKQRIELTSHRHWTDLLRRGGQNGDGKPVNSITNTVIALRGLFGDKVFALDEFSGIESLGVQILHWRKGSEVSDCLLTMLRTHINRKGGFEPSMDSIAGAVQEIAKINGRHPVQEYVLSCRWDGKPRLDSWLHLCAEARGEFDYVKAVSRIIPVAMVTRVFRPGCKFDYMPILQGRQGAGKSSLIRALASDGWYSDNLVDPSTKDAVLELQGVWVYEMGELASLAKSEYDMIKAYISRQVDRIRRPYGRKVESMPRQNVFVGSTNQDEYFSDPTGNRRFWPVSVGECDWEWVKDIRDQLFAEAYELFLWGEPIYLKDRTILEAAMREQEQREQYDAIQDTIGDWFDRQENLNPKDRVIPLDGFTMQDLFSDDGPLRGAKMERRDQLRAGNALRKLGYEKTRVQEKITGQRWAWFKTIKKSW